MAIVPDTPIHAPWPAAQLAARACRAAAEATDPNADHDLRARYAAAADMLDAAAEGALSAFAALLPDDLTPEQATRLAGGLDHSSIPEALATILDSIRPDQEEK